ncbi:MAG: hypothetical protein DHS20C17_13780 [Cyclobacteriaceae bacterium]|nr:MAG: hypothetical protein DHS20C17_13780 [Cyclobacteriaceae bacterium]
MDVSYDFEENTHQMININGIAKVIINRGGKFEKSLKNPLALSTNNANNQTASSGANFIIEI